MSGQVSSFPSQASRWSVGSGLGGHLLGMVAEFEDMGVIGEPVDEGGGQAGVAEDLGPVGKGEIGGEDKRDPLSLGR